MMQRISFVLALAFLGCGSSTPGGGDGGGGSGGGGGGGGGAADLAMPADLSSTGGFCGGQTCSGGKTCCIVGGGNPMCTSSCPDGGLSAQCAKPSDCLGATAACCITIANYMPTAVACSDGPQCVPNISAGGSGKDRACVVANDCTDNGGGMNLPDCCTSTQSGQHVCFSKALLTMFPMQLGPYFTCP